MKARAKPATGDLWSELVAAGLIGTGRKPFRAPLAEGALGAALQPANKDDAEGAWLGAAAALSLYRLAGQRPTPLPAASIPRCPPDERPRCSRAAGAHLGRMLAGEFRAALPEWLAAVQAAGRRVPEEYLPALLDFGRTNAALRPAVRAVMGQRGRWLAALNPDWDYAAAPPVTEMEPAALAEAWDTGTQAQRLLMLREVRAHDAAQALALVKRTWPQDRAAERAAFIEQLANGLSPSDEAFLETALDDRSKEVRRIAADLLARLPGSGLCRRMAERARPLLRVRARRGRLGLGRKAALEVSLPEACDAKWQRDGVEIKPPAGTGERAWWLQQVLAATPLDTWPATLGGEPRQLVVLAGQNDTGSAVLAGWIRAALRQNNAAWALALLDETQDTDVAPLAAPLLRVLGPAEREAYVYETLRHNSRLGPDQPGRRLLNEYHDDWSPRVSRLVVECLRVHLRTSDSTFGPPPDTSWLAEAALRLHPSVAAEAGPLLRETVNAIGAHYNWRPEIESALALLTFRHDMLKELTR